MHCLKGLRVIDVTQNLAGPFCTQILGDLGADVIKVEPPGTGDSARAWGPPFWEGESPLFLTTNRNKRSIQMDLKSPEEAETLRALIAGADVFVQSFRSGRAEALGFGYEAVSTLEPGLVYVSITAYGSEGPLSHLPGYDPLMQAAGGIMSVTGHSDGPPTRVGGSVVDLGTGMWAALGVLAALRDRDATGRGCHVETSLLGSALTWMSYHMIGHLATGEVPGPMGSGLAMIAPYEAFPTADGHIMINAGNDTTFRRLTEALGLEELAHDERFRDNPSRVENRPALFESIAGKTRTLTVAELLECLYRQNVPCAPIQDVAQVVGDPQVAATRMLRAAEHPRIDDYRDVAMPITWNGEQAEFRAHPPGPGEHTREVLAELKVARMGSQESEIP
ncbi:MAG: CaiB/BaiF CoA-transferase family protein [Gemmatimonadota bacterium]|nr:MAG: CaiB/BaiF CoA-transferase family protein [Gemmatimonadota bacterium]